MPTVHEFESAKQGREAIAQERLQWLIDAASEYAIAMLTPEGLVATWNAGAAKITGYSVPDALGRHFSRFFPDGTPAIEDLLETALRDGRAEIESWQIRKDGSRFWGMTVAQPARTPSGELMGFAYITRDITEKRAAQQALLESERRFRLLVEGVTDYAIYMLDPSGVVSNWNAGAERLKGYSADEIVGQHFARFYSKEERASGLPARVLEIAAREGRYEAEGWRIRKDGSRFWAWVVIDAIRDTKHHLIGFAKVTRDISERRAAQEALFRSERQFRLLIEGVRDYALYMLDPNGIVTSWNSGAERIKGYAAREIIGSHFSRFYTEDDRALGKPAKALAGASETGRFEAEGWRVRKDGTRFWAHVIIDRIQDEKGALVGFAKITRDVTERREAQAALQQAQAQRTQAQKMEALGHLTGGVAHDFNNLLMIISGQNQLLGRHAGEDPKALRAMKAIETAVARGASLTRQLLTFSRRQTLAPRAIDLDPRLEGFKTMLMGTMGGMSILTSIAPGTWPILADPNEFELSLLNLCINARDAMPNGGTITIAAENVVLAAQDTQAGIEGEFVAVSVADTGVGIAPDIMPKIFDPFFTTKQVNQGSGLGLSQVHGFTHQSGGSVTIESELGKGTRITLFLPRAASAPQPHGSEADGEAEGSGLVLLVEDNPEVADTTVAMLHQLGYETELAGDAKAGLEAIARRKPSVMLTDIIMPGDDGVVLARAVQQAHPELPIVLVTGYGKNIPTSLEVPLLRKPFNLAELGRSLRSAITAKAPQPANLIRLTPHPRRTP